MYIWRYYFITRAAINMLMGRMGEKFNTVLFHKYLGQI